MIQRLLLLTVALVALSCEAAFGLGLGGLELDSALNQEFKAEIELTNTEGLTVEEILPNLASQDDFDRVGVERNYILTNLRFRVVQNDEGKLAVRVTSQRPIIEPFLNFIVEVLWPNGRILREYTVLLDPPVFAPPEQGVVPISPSQTYQGSTQGRPAQASTQRRPIPPAPAKKQERAQEGENSDDEYGMTGAGDTLWEIAMKTRPDDSVSIQQTMLALQKANPEAFINNNVNLLKAGYVLRVPDRNEIRQETSTSANAEVRLQNQEFEDYRSGRVAQLDATRRKSRGDTSSSDQEDGELRLLAADRSQGQRSGDSAEAQALENELAVAQEDLDRARRANTELNVRLDDLAGERETLNKIVTLKDDQLAALRAQVQKMQEVGVDPGSVDLGAPTATPSEPAAPQQQGSLLTNPLVLGGLVLLLLVGAVGGLFFMRKKQQAAGLEEDDFTGLAIDDDLAEVAEEEPEEEAEKEESAEEEGEELAPQTSDAISEAEIYITYGRFPQAITFLQNAIEAEPKRADIQLKLLEVYVTTEDATAFNLQLDQLKGLGDDDAVTKAEEMQAQIPGASENAEAAMEATIISSEPIAAVEELDNDDDDDFSFDLDDDEGISFDLDDDEGISLDLDDSEELDLAEGDDDAISLDDDAEIDLGEIDLGDDDDDALSLGLDEDDDSISLDLDGDDALSLDLDDDLEDLNLDADASTNLDLARAYIDMGDKDGAKSLLQKVISEGTDADIEDANELMGELD